MKTNKEQLDAIAKILQPKNGEKNHVGKKNPKEVNRYIWTVNDEILAIELYKSKASKETIKETIKETDIKLSSMLMKIKNVEYLDTGKGLKNVSESLITLWDKLK